MGSATAESESLKYSEGAFYRSLWTMIHTIRSPPKNSKDFVVGYFISRAHDILMACNAYVEGAQVGCLVKGDKSCSVWFTLGVAALTRRLVEEFARIGAKDCEKFLSAANKTRDACHATLTKGMETCYVKGAGIMIRRLQNIFFLHWESIHFNNWESFLYCCNKSKLTCQTVGFFV